MGSALVFGAVSVLAIWIVVSVAFVGLGFGVKQLFGLRLVNLDQCFTAFWMGFSLAILFLQVWHLAFAVSWWPLAIIITAGAIGRGATPLPRAPTCIDS